MLQVWHLKDSHEVIPIWRSLLTENPAGPGKWGKPHHWGLHLLLFSNSGVGSFTFDKNQIGETVVRQKLRLTLLNYLKTLFSVGLARVWTWDFLLSRPVLISNWATQVFWEFQLQKNCNQSCSSKFMTMHLLLGRKAWLVALFWMCFLFQVLMGRSGLDPGKHLLWRLEREFLFHR